MKAALIQKFSKILAQLRGFFPQALPQGVTDFNDFVDAIIATYAMPSPLRDDIAYVVSTSIINLKSTSSYKSKWYFVQIIRAAGAKQVAGAAFQEIQLRHKAAQAAAATAEATAIPVAGGQI